MAMPGWGNPNEPTWRACDGCGVDLYGCTNDDDSEREYCDACVATMVDDDSNETDEGE